MLPRSWMEAYINFLLKFCWPIIIVLTIMTLGLAYQLEHMRVYTNFFDLYPPGTLTASSIRNTAACSAPPTS